MAECAGWCVQQQKQPTHNRHASLSLGTTTGAAALHKRHMVSNEPFPRKGSWQACVTLAQQEICTALGKKEMPAEEREKEKKGERKLEIKITEHLFHLRLPPL